MKILGVSLGHDSNFSCLVDGQVIGVVESERIFRVKHHKLHCLTLQSGKKLSGFQYTDIEDLKRILNFVKEQWGSEYDLVVVQNQGRISEHQNFLTISREMGFNFAASHTIAHHLCHASSNYFTSPFRDALILSYDGYGNDGCTVLFKANGANISYHERVSVEFGRSYNNIGYILGVKPDISGTSSGKTMGLTAYGSFQEEWVPHIRKYIQQYQKKSYPSDGKICDYGRRHRINTVGLDEIPLLKEFLLPDRTNRWDFFSKTFQLPGVEQAITQDLAHSFQTVWSQEVLSILQKYQYVSKNLCVTGGCALNGITNYHILKSGLFERVHFIPNPSDCGLSVGAALYGYYVVCGVPFEGRAEFLSPYLGFDTFDQGGSYFNDNQFPSQALHSLTAPSIIAKLLAKNYIVGCIKGACEIGPRALGHRSIFANPLHKDMKAIINDKVKHREWFRPFAPVCVAEDADQYFTTPTDIPYMSVICHTRQNYRSDLVSVTHIDGSARLQTVRKEQNPFLYSLLKEFQKETGYPILLNTSFNPGGEPILNYNAVGLEMLGTTDLDFVLIENRLFAKRECSDILKSLQK